MADPVGAGMTNGAFLELIKDTAASTSDKAVGYGTSDPAFIIAEKCDELACMKNQKQFVLSWQQNDAKIN